MLLLELKVIWQSTISLECLVACRRFRSTQALFWSLTREPDTTSSPGSKLQVSSMLESYLSKLEKAWTFFQSTFPLWDLTDTLLENTLPLGTPVGKQLVAFFSLHLLWMLYGFTTITVTSYYFLSFCYVHGSITCHMNIISFILHVNPLS